MISGGSILVVDLCSLFENRLFVLNFNSTGMVSESSKEEICLLK